MADDEFYYRLEDVQYASGVDVDGNPYPGPGRVAVKMRSLKVLGRTPKGVWLNTYNGGKRFVLASATKQYACKTREEAVDSFLARKLKQERIYRSRADTARIAYNLARNGSIES